jgi:TPR repeat protein
MHKRRAVWGDVLFNGYGTAKNEVEAVKWYRKAAEQGDAQAHPRAVAPQRIKSKHFNGSASRPSKGTR